MTEEELKEYYESDAGFKEFIDKCRKNKGRTVEEMLKLEIIKACAEDFKERSKDNV